MRGSGDCRLRAADCGFTAAAAVFAALIAGCTAHGPTVESAGTQALAGYSEKNPAATGQMAAQPGSPTAKSVAPKVGATNAAPEPKGAGPAPSESPAKSQPPEKPSGVAATRPPSPLKPAGPLAGFVDPLTKSGDRVPVSLEACIRRALANNLNVQIARFGPPIARTAVIEAEALFDPSWFMNNAFTRTKQQAGSFFAGAPTVMARQWGFSTGIQSLLPTGATVSLTQDWTYLWTNSQFIAPNPQYDVNLVLAVSQPLLRGAGVEVNTSPIVLAKLDQKISVEQFKIALMNTILEVESVYWDLVVAETTVASVNEALVAAQENLRIARRRFEEGKDKRVIVSLAESAATTRQADLVAARRHLARTSDLLKRLINDPELPLTQPTVLAATELPMGEPIPVGPPLWQQSMISALQNRPEIQQAEARLSQADLNERVARNGMLPQLDLAASYGLNGLEKPLDRAFDREFTTEFNDWSVGLDFSVPIGNRARTAVHHQTQLSKDVTLRTREDVRQMVLLEVSDAVRNLAAAEELVRARRAAREAAEQTVHDGEAFVSAGAALLKDLLDAQRDLAVAKVAEMQAMASYMVGLATLERAKGTLLEFNSIQVLADTTTLPPVPPAVPRPTLEGKK